MSNIKQLRANNSNIYPITHEDAVMDENGVSISDKYATKEYTNSQISALNGQIDTLNSSLSEIQNSSEQVNNIAGDLNQLQTSNKSNIVSAINEAFQYGNSVKQSLVDALIAKDVSNISTSTSMSQLITKIKDIEQGGSNIVEITGLPAWYNGGGSVDLSNTWMTGTNMPQARQGAACGAIGNNIYVCGGCTTSATSSRGTTFLNTSICYNAKTNTWSNTTIPNMPGAKYEHVAAVVDNKLYAIGGFTSYTALSNAIYSYDPVKNAWTSKTATMSTALHSMGATVINNKIYVCGGATITTSGNSWSPTVTSTAVNNAYVYDPSLDTWTSITNMTAAKYKHSCTNYNNQMFAMGGHNNNTNYCYDINAKTWTTKAILPAAVGDHTVSTLKNKIVLVAGGTGTSSTIITVRLL